MVLSVGTRLGPYEIVALIGGGGMGEVYRAKDTRLDRTVAIKVLPANLSSQPASLERFRREARAASALNHPNICALYDIGEDAGQPFLVLELLEGRNLQNRLVTGPLPLRRKPTLVHELFLNGASRSFGMPAATRQIAK